MRRALLALHRAAYERLLRPLIFRASAEAAHRGMLRALALLDGWGWACACLRALGGAAGCTADAPLPPFILAAGLVKGRGFADEAAALRAVAAGENIMPGWRSVPALVGAVEFGSFTRAPRLGNAGVVLWRSVETRSTQNRVGLKNPGVHAAAAFLARHQRHLPPVYGINIAVTPGVSDTARSVAELEEGIGAFLVRGLRPAWFTLNLSCPNTEDDPGAHQTTAHARALCSAARARLGDAAPLWVKISPDLGADQLAALMAVFAETGVAAVIATNTLPLPSPDDTGLTAGVGGGHLHMAALESVRQLSAARAALGCDVRIIGCGGVLDGESARALRAAGADALQYWSALVYRGPLAAAVIQQEMDDGR